MLDQARKVTALLRRPPAGRIGERICFIHVPKCGGTSFGQALANEYGLLGRLGERMVTIEPVASKRAAKVAGVPLTRYREELLLYHMAHPRTRYLAGHVEYSPRGHDAFGEWRFITLLRDPVAKWFSQYFYNRYKAVDHSRVELELEPFLATEAARDYGSDFVRFFARDKEADPSSDAAVRDAVAQLERFDVVGVLEELPSFLEAFRERFGVRLRMPHENSNPVADPHRRVPDELRREVERLCAPNRAVYERVRATLAPPHRSAAPVDTPPRNSYDAPMTARASITRALRLRGPSR